jgi:3-methyladenine DNA glycosylase/8-oxoguanine DNA glycosylase
VVSAALGRDPALAPLVGARPGLRVPGAWDPYELGVRAVLGQHISVAAATHLSGKVAAAFGEPVDVGDPAMTRRFPAPAVLAEADLAGVGMPVARAEGVRSFAGAVAAGDLALDGARGLETLVGELEAIRGIGPWTAHYIAMRACAEPDAFPSADLGLRRAAGNGGGPISPAELETRAEAWRPWRAYAAMHLWTTSGNGRSRSHPRATTAA